MPLKFPTLNQGFIRALIQIDFIFLYEKSRPRASIIQKTLFVSFLALVPCECLIDRVCDVDSAWGKIKFIQ